MSDMNGTEVAELLRTMLKIQALSAVRDLPTKKAKILFLVEAGLTPKEVSVIVGTSAASVSQTVYESKKKSSKES